jgi:hypothetical protein
LQIPGCFLLFNNNYWPIYIISPFGPATMGNMDRVITELADQAEYHNLRE